MSTPPPPSTVDVLLARQPIFDRKLEVHAYELLFRSSDHNRASFLDGDKASCEVLLNAYTGLSLETLTKPFPAFVNLTRNLLVAARIPPFPPEQVVIEILEDVVIDQKLVEIVREAVAQGYRFALDDFILEEQYKPLLSLVSYVKLDVMAHDEASLAAHVAELKRYPARLIAEKIETHEDYKRCLGLGFDFFQGYFLCKPRIIKGQKIQTATHVILKLLQELQDPRTTPNRIENLLAQDSALSYKLLRIINSAAYNLPRKVESLRQAVNLLGLNQLRSWAAIIALSGKTDKPRELANTLLVRARFCELVAEAQGYAGPGAFFMAGLLSGLDALLDTEMAPMLAQLPISEDITLAILGHQGIIGAVLDAALALEQGDWNKLLTHGLPEDRIQEAYVRAVIWARELMEAMAG